MRSQDIDRAHNPRDYLWRGWIYLLLVTAALGLGSCTLADSSPGEAKNAGMPKVASDLIVLHREYSSYLASGKSGVFKSSNPLMRLVNDRVLIDAVASDDAATLKSDLEALGMQHGVAYGRVVSGQLPILAIPSITKIPSLNFARATSGALQGGSRNLPPGTPQR